MWTQNRTKESTKQSIKGIYGQAWPASRQLQNSQKRKNVLWLVAHTLLILSALTLIQSLFSRPAHAETGIASFYGNGEKLNRLTATGDVFYPSHLTAASYHFKLKSFVRCKSMRTGKSIVVFVNDLGPNKRLGRLIDLSHGAFKLIDDPSKGVTNVSCETVQP